ncbi:30S ribosomal protein S21 [Rhynchospora pubera]|uniref:30S ribosomal protein S21 n=1 Tax=Rhynchospora pubera TaxID=906938 RepID=A0AAV8F684_9POAL|nr:30S ribosomal protein S21 [Rhynchospora pubera]
MQQSLTTNATNPLLFLRLRTKSSPPPPLRIPTPQPNKPPSLELKLDRPQRIVLYAKEKSFNVEVVVEEEDDLEECLNRFNRQVAGTGLLRECRRRRFHENAREKLKRKRRDAGLFRRRQKRLYRQKLSSKRNEKTPIEKDDVNDDSWIFSDESFEELIDDEKEESKEEIESHFQDDGEGTWQLFDGISHT